MTDQRSTDHHSRTTSTGDDLSESSYLDIHFDAMRSEYEAMIRSVGIKPGWHVLDAGCGGGSFLTLLAELVGSSGHISALDQAPEHIEEVETLVDSGRFVCPVAAKLGKITSLPYEDNSFDAVWCAAVTQYLTDEELQKMLVEFRRIVRPHGIVAVKDFDLTLHQLIPGDPIATWILFEALQAVNRQIQGTLRVLHLPIWLKKAGLIDVRYKTTICERQAPLRPAEQEFIGGVYRFYASKAENIGLPEPVLMTWRKLGNTDSPDHIMKQPDFYYREGHIITVAKVPNG